MTGQRLYRRAIQLIPGGTQLLSKRPEMFAPDHWPVYYSRARGVEVEDLDGRRYTDMSLMGVGACILGYADPDVDTAVKEAIERGTMCTLNAPEEVELAELLCQLHPWAGMARYARTGGEAMSIAVRIARAHTGRDKVAFCGYHGWSDWYLAANLTSQDALDTHLMPGLDARGVPKGLAGTALPFHYNRIDQLESIVASQGPELAAIVMEPQRGQAPRNQFLQGVRQLASDTGAALIFDEITTGFRMTTGGIHLLLGVDPDIAVFAKALANGYPMAAVIGRPEVMGAAQKTFISSTNWTERLGPAAALATIRKHQAEKVAEHLKQIGEMVQKGWENAARAVRLELSAYGLPSLCEFGLKSPDQQLLKTLFTQEMLGRGYLACHQFKPSFAHRPEHVEHYLEDVQEVFSILESTSRQASPPLTSDAGIAHDGFYRMT